MNEILENEILEGDPVDLNSIRTEYREITLSSDIGPGLLPGSGIDVSNPYWPKPVSFAPFVNQNNRVDVFEIHGDQLSDDRLTVSTAFKENVTIEEEAEILSANFHASYLLSSADAAFAQARETRRTGKAVYFFYNLSGQARTINPGNIQWNDGLLADSEAIPDSNLRLRYFIERYGTHYVQSVQYGVRLAIRGELKTLDEVKQKSLSGKLNLALGTVAIDGQISAADRQAFRTQDINIQAELTAGGVKPNVQAVVLTGMDQIADFLDKFRRGGIILVAGPVSCKAWSYWATLDPEKHPALFKDFSPSIREAAPSPFGVPPGTVLAWHPRPGDIIQSAAGRTIVPPNGWLICDGTQGTPNLTDRFILGTRDPNKILSQIGTKSVKPTGSGHFGGYERNEINYGQTGGGVSDYARVDELRMDPIPLIPPSAYLVFIQKQ